jgi:phosphoribosylformylglycinamidine cyclo-ligase
MRYGDAGVNIEKAEELVRRIRARSRRSDEIGRFGAVFDLEDALRSIEDPVLVSSTDGIGTKILLAVDVDHYDGLGQDLVAMNVNDVVTLGARPLFFLDYYATSVLDVDAGTTLIDGAMRACEACGCSLIGGEISELPGFFREGVPFDAAGFVVGIAQRSRIPDRNLIEPGDVLIALPSSGPHSNGFSLIRKILKNANVDLRAEFPEGSGRPLWKTLLEPTRLYVKPVLDLFGCFVVRGAAHITGGGIVGNLPRVLPGNVDAVVDTSRWEPNPIFHALREWGDVPEDEMWRVFNMGLGMILVLPGDQGEAATADLSKSGEPAVLVGRIERGTGNVRLER